MTEVSSKNQGFSLIGVDFASLCVPLLILLLIIKAFLIGGLIQQGMIGLGPDEAQYWTWSRTLDWGYYSKPPGIALQIWLGTLLFGNVELGVRMGSLILSILLSLSIYFLGRAAGTQKTTAFWASIAFTLSPLGFLSSLFAITDGGMVLCWNLASISLCKALFHRKVPSYYLIGIWILIGALFKWPIYLFWINLFLLWPFYPFLRSVQAIGGVFLSLLGLLPTIYWNTTHEWVTFRHVFTQVSGGDPISSVNNSIFRGNLLDFLAAQIGLLSPILFLLLCFAWTTLWKRRLYDTRSFSLSKHHPALFFCGSSSLLFLGTYSTLSLFQKMQGNWCDFIYPSATLFLTWYAWEYHTRGNKWFVGGILFSTLLSILLFAIPYLQFYDFYAKLPIPYRYNAFHQNMGWSNLPKTLTKWGYNPATHFLFGDTYQMSSILSFYAPQQKRAYFLNLQGARRNQFSFWPGMAEQQIGNIGYFVAVEQLPRLAEKIERHVSSHIFLLSPYFEEVEFLGTAPLFTCYELIAKTALLYKCTGYKGTYPPQSERY
jgi:hypothetical protein